MGCIDWMLEHLVTSHGTLSNLSWYLLQLLIKPFAISLEIIIDFSGNPLLSFMYTPVTSYTTINDVLQDP